MLNFLRVTKTCSNKTAARLSNSIHQLFDDPREADGDMLIDRFFRFPNGKFISWNFSELPVLSGMLLKDQAPLKKSSSFSSVTLMSFTFEMGFWGLFVASLEDIPTPIVSGKKLHVSNVGTNISPSYTWLEKSQVLEGWDADESLINEYDLTENVASKSKDLCFRNPIGSMGLVYLPTFTIKIT